MRPKFKYRYLYLTFIFLILNLSCFLLRPLTSYAQIKDKLSAQDTWFLEDIQAVAGWKALSTMTEGCSSPVVVAVIDTGVDYTHPLFQNALWENTLEKNGLPNIDDDNNGYIDDIYGIDTYHHTGNPIDDSTGSLEGHGTHVAGTILLTCGVTETENPFQIQLMLLKAGDAYGNFSYEDVAEAMYYATDHGASVINMSLSTSHCPEILENAIQYAKTKAVIVSSAGNKGLPTSDSGFLSCGDFYPAAHPNVVGVMSYNRYRNLSFFSNWDYCSYKNAEYEVAAPGENIFSCYYNSAYKSTSGTSMASGIVSGCAALLCKKFQNYPDISPELITAHIMEQNSQIIPYTDANGTEHTFHKLDLYQLLTSAVSPKLILSGLSVSATPGSVFILDYTLTHRGLNTVEQLPEIYITDHNGTSTKLDAKTIEKSPINTWQTRIHGTFLVPETMESNQELTITVTYFQNKTPVTASCIWYYGITPTPTQTISPDVPLYGITVCNPKPLLKIDETVKLTVEYLPANASQNRTLTFVSSAPEIATVSSQGIIRGISCGNATITVVTDNRICRNVTVTVYQSELYKGSATPTPTITYTPPKKISTQKITLSQNRFSWNNKIQKPVVHVKGLNAGTDYIVSYHSPKSRNLGTYHLTIKGIGAYTGSVTKTYAIYAYKKQIYKINGYTYKITSANSKCKTGYGSVTLTGSISKKIRLLNVKDDVNIGGKKYHVTAIEGHSFKNYKKLKKVVIGKYVKKIGAYCFYNDTNLQKITYKNSKLPTIGKCAFKGAFKLQEDSVPRR